MKKSLIIGKGWLGSRLEKFLEPKYNLITTKRISDSNNCLSINFDQEISTKININSFDFIIILIPFGRRNSTDILSNRFKHLVDWIKEYKNQIFLISSTGIYPSIEKEINEKSLTNAQLVEPYITIEQVIKQAFPQLNILRLGGLMGDDRYLSKYVTENSANLEAVVNQIHYQDVISIIEKLIEKEITDEIYNITTPIHPQKGEIVAHQTNKTLSFSNKKNGKTISSDKIINDLNYQFIFPNPIYFKD